MRCSVNRGVAGRSSAGGKASVVRDATTAPMMQTTARCLAMRSPLDSQDFMLLPALTIHYPAAVLNPGSFASFAGPERGTLGASTGFTAKQARGSGRIRHTVEQHQQGPSDDRRPYS